MRCFELVQLGIGMHFFPVRASGPGFSLSGLGVWGPGGVKLGPADDGKRLDSLSPAMDVVS